MAKKTIINKPILDDSQKKSPLTDEQILEFLNRGVMPNGSTAADLGAAGLYQTRGDDYLMQLLYQQYITSKDKGANAAEMNMAIYKEMLAYFKMLEQRGYDKDALNEQRQYDSPISQLMRLMSTGMSRDAAIQALTGGQDAALVGSGAGTETTPTLSPQEVRSQQIQNGLGIFNAAVGTLGTIGQLTSLGFSIPQAIHQTQVTKAAATMSKEQVKAYQSVNAVTSALDTFGNTVGSISDLQGLTNADDAYKFMQDHKDTDLFKPLFDNGAIGGTFGNTIGREMFNNFWREKFSSETDGQRLFNQVQKEEFEKSMAEYSAGKLQKDFELLVDTFDEQITLIEQQVKNGELVISINGEELKLKKDAAWLSSQERSITDEFYNTEIDGKPAKHHIALNSALELYGQFCMNQVKYGTDEARKRFKNTCESDANFAYSMAFIKQYMAGKIQVEAEEKSTLTELGIKLTTSGLMSALSVTDVAGSAGGLVSTGVNAAKLILTKGKVK